YFNGSLSSTRNVIYAGGAPKEGSIPTSGIGVDRSIDGGITWKNIGGPLESFDTRTIAAVNDNIVLVLDTGGSVWRTMNSGGDSLAFKDGLEFTPGTLFAGDTVACDSLRRTLAVHGTSCSPSITALSITGRDSSNFRIVSSTSDSIAVMLQPFTSGEQQASLLVRLSDGLIDTISLGGFSNYTHSSFFVSPSSLFNNDTVQCDSVTGELAYELIGCYPRALIGITIHGRDSSDYRASQTSWGTILVTLMPGDSGSKQASLVLGFSDSTADTVSLGGYVSRFVPDSIAATPATLFSGDTAQCDSVTRYVTLARFGCSPPSVSGIGIAGNDSASFHAGTMQSDSIPVTLIPGQEGTKHASLVISRSDGKSDTVWLAGYVAARPASFSIRPTALFANDTIGCDSETQIVRIYGAGCAPAALLSYWIAGTDSASYRAGIFHSDSLPITILPGNNGANNASLVISLTDGSFDTVALAGYVSQKPNTLTVAPRSLFSSDTVYCDSLTRMLAIHASGCAPPSIASISISGRDSSSFEYSRTPDSISVMLLPRDTGTISAFLLVTSSDGATDTVFLNGFRSTETGSVSISPRVLFANDTLHCDSIKSSIVIRMKGCSPPSLMGWSITGRDSASFFAGEPSGDTLPFTLIPQTEGDQQAFAILQFSNGTLDTVSLLGVNAPARTMTIDTTPIDLGAAERCETRDTAIPYTNTSCVPVVFKAWRMAHYGDGLDVYNINYQPITIPAGATDSLHITFDGMHTGLIYDTVVLMLGTDADSVRRIPVQTYVPAVDTVNFILSMPAQLSAGEHFAANVLPDRAVTGKGLTSVSGLLHWPTNDFEFDSITAAGNLALVSNTPYS
ncbi:MAG: WD40/YVTN/BNR-like repeat-containing protein, partial [Candidatus Kapaibacterium sp.]